MYIYTEYKKNTNMSFLNAATKFNEQIYMTNWKAEAHDDEDKNSQRST